MCRPISDFISPEIGDIFHFPECSVIVEEVKNNDKGSLCEGCYFGEGEGCTRGRFSCSIKSVDIIYKRIVN